MKSTAQFTENAVLDKSELNQSLLFPPSLHDWLPDNHLARFLADVVNALDLEAIYSSYNDKDGRWMSA